MAAWQSELLSIVLLLAAIAVVLRRLPKVDVGHSEAFKRRRFYNWFPLGLTYALLYFGRYNLSANQPALDDLGLLDKGEFGNVDAIGSTVYGVAFLLNGPLTDRWGGRATILLAAGGSAVANVAMAFLVHRALGGGLAHAEVVRGLTLLFSVNMYFQSFGAVSIVKVNAPWFHLRERGILGGVFGILISLGLYFSYDWSRILAKSLGMTWAFAVPAAVLVCLFAVDIFAVRNSPADAGFEDFDTADASSGDTGERLPLLEVAKRMFSQKVIWIIVAIEFCSGFLRNAVMKWYLPFAKDTGTGVAFIKDHWGALLCVAGIIGGMFAGLISDRVFDSRRGPVASVLYGGLTAGAVATFFLLGGTGVGWSVMFMSLCVIGVHGMLSGTASADFGGKKNAGIATGIIDGFVYLGTAAQSFLYGAVLPQKAAAKVIANWKAWPLTMIPVAVVGFALATRVWNAKPKGAQPAASAKPREPEAA
jgi:MFS transporter, OPA family, glycerol-3-phosphate transporter